MYLETYTGDFVYVDHSNLSRMSRQELISYLESRGTACFDSESTEELRQCAIEDLEDELFEDGTLYDEENVYVPVDIADNHIFEESESQAILAQIPTIANKADVDGVLPLKHCTVMHETSNFVVASRVTSVNLPCSAKHTTYLHDCDDYFGSGLELIA